jgi:hypothetical protein
VVVADSTVGAEVVSTVGVAADSTAVVVAMVVADTGNRIAPENHVGTAVRHLCRQPFRFIRNRSSI